MLRALSAVCAALLLAIIAAGCGGDDNASGDGAGDTVAQTGGETGGAEPIKVGFMYIGPPGDAGWTFQHDEARKFVEEQMPNVETTFLDSVPEANSGPAIDQLISGGNKLIFATSFGYGDTVVQKAQQNPDVLFEHATGFQRADNVSTYFVQHWEPSFLIGMIAGRMTKSNRLGYVGSFPIPEVIRDVNAFTLGAQSVNPDVKVQVVLISTWFDPPKEKQAAKSLIDAGADVLFGIEDSPSVLQEAAANGVYAGTWNSDMSRFGPEAFLSAVVLNWGEHYVNRVKAALDGSWESEDYWGTLEEGTVELAPYGDAVPQEVRDEVDEKLAGFKDGSFKPFVGPIKDQTGKVRFEEGHEISFEEWVAWDWFVEGVEGKLPG
jgi:basic membrane protein A and related proteins